MGKIALWGLGRHGRKLFEMLASSISRSFQINCLIDKNPQILSEYRTDPEMLCISPEEVESCYKNHCFDAVIIGTTVPEYYRQITRILHKAGIPVLNPQIARIFRETGTAALKEDVSEESIVGELDFPALNRNVQTIDSHLSDPESKALFRARLCLMVSQDRFFFDTIREYSSERTYHMWDLYVPMQRCGAIRVILIGEDTYGAYNLHALRMCGVPVAAFCALDEEAAESAWPEEKTIIFPEDLMDPAYDDCLVVVSSQKRREEIRRILIQIGFPQERVFDPPDVSRPILVGSRHLQYFDVWKPLPHEIFVDCGAYDGQTLLDFQQWAADYEAIYALEPLPNMLEKIAANTSGMENLTVYPVAAWDKAEELVFQIIPDISGSHVLSNGSASGSDIVVQGKALDDLIPGRISFLKMDIEGSELAAINGASGLIRKWKPRLAICIYHNAEDILEIPLRILELVPEYQFRIRHYGTGLYETVLYASVDNEIWLDKC